MYKLVLILKLIRLSTVSTVQLEQKLKSSSSAKQPVSEAPIEAVDESRLTSAAPGDKGTLNDLDEMPVKETKVWIEDFFLNKFALDKSY